jgi:hypothetical protein
MTLLLLVDLAVLLVVLRLQFWKLCCGFMHAGGEALEFMHWIPVPK